MANGKTRLELTWIGKDLRPRLEPRVLLEDPAKSHHAAARVSDHDLFDNRLIHGDNLLALKALEQEFTGKVKCVYIDPPYNTGSAFEQYDDGVEHSLWLSLVRDRLEILKRLLAEDGSIWISIDDSECHYLKVLCDETFGRANFVGSIIWEKRKSRENRRVFSFKHDYILVYAADRPRFEAIRNTLPLTPDVLARYRNPDNDPRGPWQSISATAQAGHATSSQFYELVLPNGARFTPPDGRCWSLTQPRMEGEIAANRIWFGRDGRSAPRIKRFLREHPEDGLTPETIWYADDVATNDDAKKALMDLFDGRVVFDTPKPEALVSRIVAIATNPGDLVLDSFLGSGTSAAVAHKMGRRWIGIELGDHCESCCVPRLRKVIDGQDPGGITDAVGWKGGGGFRYYDLAPSLLQKDRWGQWVVNRAYNGAMLAEALCKLSGFRYQPSDTVWWQQGRSTEQDYLYGTTRSLTFDELQAISEEVGPDRTLLLYCASFDAPRDGFANLTLRKIPAAVLQKCEWGRDDYSLQIEALPEAPPAPPSTPPVPGESGAGARPARRRPSAGPDLFGEGGDE